MDCFALYSEFHAHSGPYIQSSAETELNANCMLKNGKNFNGIKEYNKKILTKEQSEAVVRSCNCRDPTICPLDGHCLDKGAMYEATVNSVLPRYETRTYKGITDRTINP